MPNPAVDVTVVIPTFNRVDLLRRAVASVLAQRCRIEVIVVDDGSTEDVKTALEQARSGAVSSESTSSSCASLIYVRQERQGACTARNEGLLRAAGEFVKFLDSDDELLPDVLPEEVRVARETGAEVVVTGWVERWLRDTGDDGPVRDVVVSAPDLRRGIDDMLLGRGPWTSAALYKRSFVSDLRWDPAWVKAQDWGWALRVCLAGARFHTLNRFSAVYNHHSGTRITGHPDRVALSTDARQSLLRMVENQLTEQGRLTEHRRRALAQYYYRDAIVVCESCTEDWRTLWLHCLELDPKFVPANEARAVGVFTDVLGPYHGIRLYVLAKRLYRRLGTSFRESH